MSKITPGPWRVEVHDCGTFVTRDYPNGGDTSAVSICSINGPCLMVPEPQPEGNARLIAAAPELLAALENAPQPDRKLAAALAETITTRSARTQTQTRASDYQVVRYRDWYDGPRLAAIAKARGEK